MITFQRFFLKFNLRNKAKSNLKIQHVLPSLSLYDVGIYLRDGPFSSDIGIVIFDSHGCVRPKKLFKFIIKRNGYCLNSKYQIQTK